MRHILLILLPMVLLTGCGTVDMPEIPSWPEGWFWNKPDPKPEQPEPDEFTTAKLYTCPQSVSEWPVVSKLTATITGSRIRFSVDNADVWRPVEGDIVAEMHTLLYRAGSWRAGPSDGVHAMPSYKEKSSACVPRGDERLYEPVKGEQVGFVLTGCCRNGRFMRPQQRTDICWVVWP